MNKLKLFRLYDTVTKKYTNHSFNSKRDAKNIREELNIKEPIKRFQVRRASDHRLGET